MNLRDIQYFVTLAETCHFGEAAKKCFVSQPTLSMQIKKLEESLGVGLFERNNKQVLLTDIGRTLLPEARALLMQVKHMQEIARMATDPLAGSVRLGVIPTVAPYLLPFLFPKLQSALPQMKWWIIEEKTHVLIEQLQTGAIDAAIMAHPVPDDSFQAITLFDEPFLLVCALQHPLARQQQVTIEAMHDLPMMLLEEGHCLREQAIAACHLEYPQLASGFSATSLETLRFMVQANYGVTLFPELAVIGEKRQGLAIIPFQSPSPFRTIRLYWRASSPRGILFNKLANLVKESYATRI